MLLILAVSVDIDVSFGRPHFVLRIMRMCPRARITSLIESGKADRQRCEQLRES